MTHEINGSVVQPKPNQLIQALVSFLFILIPSYIFSDTIVAPYWLQVFFWIDIALYAGTIIFFFINRYGTISYIQVGRMCWFFVMIQFPWIYKFWLPALIFFDLLTIFFLYYIRRCSKMENDIPVFMTFYINVNW